MAGAKGTMIARRELITGCSSGIGRALAVELAGRGHAVIATARREEALEGLNVDLKLPLDVTDPESVTAALVAAGEVDVLVNNAGLSVWGVVEAPSDADVQRLFETNVFGALRMIRCVLPQMRARRSGAVFQISSAAARRSTAMLGHYAASKAALDAYSAALRIELAPFGIAVCSVVLGPVETALGKNRIVRKAAGYEAIMAGSLARVAATRTAPATVEDAARNIADAIELEHPPLQIDGSGDGFALVAQRRGQDDDAWEEATLRGLLGDNWREGHGA